MAKQTLISAARDIGHVLVGAYSVMLMLFSMLTPIATAQHTLSSDQFPSDLGRRMDDIEKLNLDHRITIIETTLQDLVSNFSWYRVTSGGTGILLMEAVYRHTKKKKEEDDNA